jgi:hypothetical protein
MLQALSQLLNGTLRARASRWPSLLSDNDVPSSGLRYDLPS